MESITDTLNEIFSRLSNLTLEKKFEPLDSYFQGEFIINTQKVPLYFVAIIPLRYPFGEIKFYTKTIMGYPHQIYLNENYGGALCLNTPFVNNFNTKLNLDIEKLYGWIKKYYENDGEDEHYEYPIYSKISECKLIFQETAEDFNDARFSEVKFGKFNLSILNDDLENKNSPHVALLAHNLGNKSSTWSNLYSNFVEKPLGFWVYIEEEPVIEKKHKITDFNDLIKLFPQGFKDFLFENIAKKEFKIKELKKHKIFSYLAVGYKIPTSNGQYEVHWDLALIFTKYFAKEKINWAVSNNASYDRFFGRGRLCDSIVNSKIIVLGLGAIGSSLCETLVRGGVKDLSISDYDSVDTGNICRSIYTFKNTGYSKVEKLAERLMQISPYVNLSYAKPLMAHIESSKEFVEIKEEINKLDLIIDCTANNEALELINLYDFKNKVIHISITDKSKQMLCISNDYSTNIAEKRNNILTFLQESSEPTFREGTGCYYPTFQASFFDINGLLNFTIREINDMMKKNKFRNFVAAYKDKEGAIAIDKDIIFNQKQLNLGLIITSECIEKIKQISYTNYPYEFGGYLIGYYSDNGKVVYVIDIITPTHYSNSPVSFQPDKKSMNDTLSKIHEDFEGKIRYLGEWHTHPNMSNTYSLTDYYSMSKIATSKDVAINNPLMLIISLGRNYFNPAFYVYFEKYLYEFERDV